MRAGSRDGKAAQDDFAIAVEFHHRDLARFALRLCGDRTEAEDIVAEAYARVWPRWRRGRVDGLLPYLLRSVANEAYTRHRRRRRLEAITPPAPRSPRGFEEAVDQRDALWAALDRLPRKQRVVVVLRVVEDLSEDETAAMLGVPRGTVKSRLARGLAALRAMVEEGHG